ncbi:hypothetical protein D3C72_1645440 [compost metagenome]
MAPGSDRAGIAGCNRIIFPRPQGVHPPSLHFLPVHWIVNFRRWPEFLAVIFHRQARKRAHSSGLYETFDIGILVWSLMLTQRYRSEVERPRNGTVPAAIWLLHHHLHQTGPFTSGATSDASGSLPMEERLPPVPLSRRGAQLRWQRKCLSMRLTLKRRASLSFAGTA